MTYGTQYDPSTGFYNSMGGPQTSLGSAAASGVGRTKTTGTGGDGYTMLGQNGTGLDPNYQHGGGSAYGTDQSTPNRNIGQSNANDSPGFSLFSTQGNPDPYAAPVDDRAFQWGGTYGGGNNAMWQYQEKANQSANRGNAYDIDQGMQMGARVDQMSAMNSYRDAMNGKGPSIAQMQLAKGAADNNAAASGMAASSRGGGANMASAQRNAMMQQGSNNSNLGQQSAMLRAEEINQARAGFAGAASQMRGQDQSWQGVMSQNALANRQLNDQQRMGYEQLGYGVGNAQLGAAQRDEQLKYESEQAARAQREAQQVANTKYQREDQKDFVNSIGGMLGIHF